MEGLLGRGVGCEYDLFLGFGVSISVGWVVV